MIRVLDARRVGSTNGVQEVHEMNGASTRVARSVQLAVMAAPTTTVAEAVAEARRRHETVATWITQRVQPRMVPATA
jgi:hypothetical protein